MIIDLRVSPPSQRKDDKKLTHIVTLIMFKTKADNLPPDPKYPANLKELGYVRSTRHSYPSTNLRIASSSMMPANFV
jgi:hypothetical protein